MRDIHRATARSSLHALASLMALVAGCSLTTSLDGLSDHRARSNASRDAGAESLEPPIEIESGAASPDVEATQPDSEPAVAIDAAVDDPCPDGACRNPLCSNGALDGDETAVDCGGSCAACPTGHRCLRSSDCASKVCSMLATSRANQSNVDADVPEVDASDSGGVIEDEARDAPEDKICQASVCSDRVMNGTESDVDCGGSCPRCLPGARCGAWIDCSSSVCTNGKCAVPSCTDGVKNGDEPGIDCGGSCPKCLAGQGCLSPTDCAAAVCEDGVCKGTSCTDHVKNGAETDIDCGGGTCPKCPNGYRCSAKSDCQGGQCAGGTCRNF